MLRLLSHTVVLQNGNGQSIHPGSRGVYVTCEKDFEKRATREVLEALSRVISFPRRLAFLLTIMMQYVEEEPVAEEPAEATEQPVDISKEVKAEVSQLKKKTSSLFHIKYMSGVHGSGFLVFEPSKTKRFEEW